VDTVADHWRGLLNLAVAQVGLKKTSEAQKNLRKAFKASGTLKLSSEESCIGSTAAAVLNHAHQSSRSLGFKQRDM
jgi:hypothetical protein